jgi:hypothetical protein
MKEKVINTTIEKALGYVCSLGLVHEKLCDKLSVHLEEATRKGRQSHKGPRLPEPSGSDRSIHYEPPRE